MMRGARRMPYAGHPIKLEDGRRVSLDMLFVDARRLRAAELRSLWSGVPACGARFARFLRGWARAQRFSEVTAISRTLELSLPLMPTDPSLADVFDQDAMIRRIADVTGVPAELLRDPAVVEQMRAARQEASQQQSMAQMAIQGAGPMAKLIEAQKMPEGGGQAAA